MIKEISVEDFASLPGRGEEYCLLDVRNPQEHTICKLEQAQLIPLPELADRVSELNQWRDKPIYALCHHGVRSVYAAQFLSSQGFSEVINITGGIDAWAIKVEPSMPRY